MENKTSPQQGFMKVNREQKEDEDQIDQDYIYNNDFKSKSRTKQNEGQGFDDEGEDEEFDAKFALLDAENSSNMHHSVLKTQNLVKKKSLDSWDQEEPGFTDVRSFGNKLSGFKTKQFGYPHPQYRSNQTYRFGNRSNYRLGGTEQQQRYTNDRNYKDNNGGLFVQNQRFLSNQSLSPQPTDTIARNQMQLQNISNISLNNMNKSQEQQNSSLNGTHKPSVDNSDTTQDIINENNQNRNQDKQQNIQQFKKWEKDEQNEDNFLNSTKQKYGLSSNQSAIQIPQNMLHHFQICPSLQTPQVASEMKIFGNSFNSLKKSQEGLTLNSSNIFLPSVKTSKLKKVDLNTNLQIPNERNTQILFPSSLNMNLLQPINQQQLLSEQLRQKQAQLSYKYHINYPKINQQTEDDNVYNQNQNNEQIDFSNNSQQNYSNIINFPQIDLNGQRAFSDLMFEQGNKEGYQRLQGGIQNKQIQIFNMDTDRITPIHSERIYYQVEQERDNAQPYNNQNNGRVGQYEIKLNNNSSLKSQSLSPLRFPRHKAIPPMRMKYKKKERDGNSQELKESSQMDSEENNLQSQILSIKNIKPQQKIQQQKQLTLPQTNTTHPIPSDKLDSLLKIISPSLYSSSQKVVEDKSDQHETNKTQSNEEQEVNQNNIQSSDNTLIDEINTKINQDQNIESLESNGNNEQNKNNDNIKDNYLLNVNGESPKLKVYSLKFKGGQQSKQVQNEENGKYLSIHNKQKHGISPRSLSPNRSFQNQNQINKMPQLAMQQQQSQSQYYKKDVQFDQQLNKNNINNKFNYLKQEIFNKQKGAQHSQNAIMTNIQLSSTSNQHHIDFMDYVQGKSANIMNKSQTQNTNNSDELAKKKNSKSEQDDKALQKNISQVKQDAEQNSLIKKVNSYSKFAERKLSPSPVRKVKTAFMPNSQSQANVNLTFNVNFQNQVNNIHHNQNPKDTQQEQSNQNKQYNKSGNNEVRGMSLNKKSNKEITMQSQNKK